MALDGSTGVLTHSPIYLDYNATTPVDPRVLTAMLPYFSHLCGNSSSGHWYGARSAEAVLQARASLAELIGACTADVLFSSGGSEGNNLVIKGVVLARYPRPTHVITSAIDHPATLTTLRYLKQRLGTAYTLVPVDGAGMIDPDDVRQAITPSTALISIMHANNEVGTVQPVRAIAAIGREAGVAVHTDAAQSAGKVHLDVGDLGVDLLSLAAHKFYGPKGMGALYRRAQLHIDPLIHGAAQEGGMRAGTENVPGIVGIGEAAMLARVEQPADENRLTALRDRLEALLAEAVPHLRRNGHDTQRLPNTLNVSFPGVLGQTVLEFAPEVAASTGSACHSGHTEPSSVLLAMGIPADRALGAVRLSLGRWTSGEDIDRAAAHLIRAYRQARTLSSAVAG